MAKSDQQNARAQAQNTSNQAQQQLAPVIQGNQQQQQVDYGRASEDYSKANAGLDKSSGTLDTASGTLGNAGKSYQNFADTGGFSAADKTQYLNRATSGVTNTGTNLMQRAQQARSKSGGAGTGGEIAQISRQLSQTQADATNNAQVSLNQQINANKLAGSAGLVSTGNAQTNVGSAQTDVAKAHSMLFDANTGAASDLGKQVLAAYGLQYQTEDQANKILAQLATTPGVFDNIMRVASLAVSGANAYGNVNRSNQGGS